MSLITFIVSFYLALFCILETNANYYYPFRLDIPPNVLEDARLDTVSYLNQI